jgi:hypothetical protein
MFTLGLFRERLKRGRVKTFSRRALLIGRGRQPTYSPRGAVAAQTLAATCDSSPDLLVLVAVLGEHRRLSAIVHFREFPGNKAVSNQLLAISFQLSARREQTNFLFG